MTELSIRLQQEVQEIADVLARQSGKTTTQVWEEALSLHRVRYETTPLPDTEPELNRSSQ
jgi:predicted transcriptional regulator